jgi:ribosome maturation factor RimP
MTGFQPSTSAPTAEESIKPNSKEALEFLCREVEGFITPLGYEVVALEMVTAGGRTLRLFIDFLNNRTAEPGQEQRIGLDDCITVNGAVDEFLEQTTLLTGSYNLEVSSPGLDRPLRKTDDYNRFKGRRVRVGTYRPLTATELGDNSYWEKNQKQKNFIGELVGLNETGADVIVKPEGYKSDSGVRIPLTLVSKAHLEEAL